MSLFESVCDPGTGEIRSAEWDRHARQSVPVGRCSRCGGLQFGAVTQRDWGLVYRDVSCHNGHEATIPGSRYKGRVEPGAEQLTIDRTQALHLVPDPED